MQERVELGNQYCGTSIIGLVAIAVNAGEWVMRWVKHSDYVADGVQIVKALSKLSI
jgi:hypothetical protein